MQQRRASAGRPSGTDGYDFSYRMVVDSRYQKVAEGRSRLRPLILIQAIVQLAGALLLFLSASKGEIPNAIAISSLATGAFALIFGELGRRRSRAGLLKVYMIVSSSAVALSIACVAKSNLTLEGAQNLKNWESKKLELLEGIRVLFGLLMQIFVVSTVVSLVNNMSPPKRAS